MFKVIISVLIIFSFITIISCSNKEGSSSLLNEKITEDNISELAVKMKNDKDITKDEIDYFAGGITRLSTLSKDTLFGMTVSNVIESQKEAAFKNSLEQLDNAALRTQLTVSQAFQFEQMLYSDSDTMKTNIIKFKVQNKSKKNIKNLQGMMSVINQQNQIIKKYPIRIMMVLAAGQTYEMQTPPYIHNDKDPNDALIRTQPGSLRPVWQCVFIEFEDGKQVGKPLPVN